MKSHLDLELTESAKAAIHRFIGQVPSGHVLSLVQAGLPGGAGSGWEIGTYTNDKISAAEKEFEKAGCALRYMIDGIEFVIEPQFARLLEGKWLDFSEGRFYTKGRENGI